MSFFVCIQILGLYISSDPAGCDEQNPITLLGENFSPRIFTGTNASMKQNCIPLTLLLVGAIYLGSEVVNGLSVSDNISQLSHIVGGVCGAIFGMALSHGNRRR